MKRRAASLAVLLLLLGGAWAGRDLLNANARTLIPRRRVRELNVETAVAEVRPMPVLIHAVGQVESEHVVDVRPQVSGMLQSVAFTEGARIKAGQLLFRIDPAPFRAAVAQARAALARDQAALANAVWQVQRLAPLAKLDYVTPQEFESAKTAAKQARDAISADKAALEQARIQLGYTQIRSPITGRAGAVSVKAGNLVQANSSVALVTINQLSPILVRFSVPQSELELVRRYRARGAVPVRLSEKGAMPAATGRLVFIDNAVDPATGTVTLKAEFPNRADRLWPGEYADVDLQLTVQPHAVVIPETAVQPGQNGPFVYLVRDGRARVQPVSVARQVGNLAVVGHGLSGGETVVVEVPRSLRDGARVHPAPVARVHARAPASSE